MNKVALVELHDGTLSTISISVGRLELEFSNLSCFLRTELATRFEVRKCRGKLICLELGTLDIRLMARDAFILSDGSLYVQGNTVQLGDDATHRGNVALELTTSDGGELMAVGKALEWRMREAGPVVEYWDGPLTAGTE